MRNEKRITFQAKRIEELEKERKDLIQENKMLSSQLEINKRTILFRENVLKEKEKFLDETIRVYEITIDELRTAKEKYDDAIESARELKNKYEAEMKKQFARIKKTKKQR